MFGISTPKWAREVGSFLWATPLEQGQVESNRRFWSNIQSGLTDNGVESGSLGVMNASRFLGVAAITLATLRTYMSSQNVEEAVENAIQNGRKVDSYLTLALSLSGMVYLAGNWGISKLTAGLTAKCANLTTKCAKLETEIQEDRSHTLEMERQVDALHSTLRYHIKSKAESLQESYLNSILQEKAIALAGSRWKYLLCRSKINLLAEAQSSDPKKIAEFKDAVLRGLKMENPQQYFHAYQEHLRKQYDELQEEFKNNQGKDPLPPIDELLNIRKTFVEGVIHDFKC